MAILVRDHLPVKLRQDLMVQDIEALWLKVQLPHLKPFLIGCCYRVPSANIQYLDSLRDILDRVTEESRELYLLGDINIDCLSETCPLRNKLKSAIDTCGLSQLIYQPTRISTNIGVTRHVLFTSFSLSWLQ